MVNMSAPNMGNLGGMGLDPSFLALLQGDDRQQNLQKLSDQMSEAIKSQDPAKLVQALQKMSQMSMEDILAILQMLDPEAAAALANAMSSAAQGGGAPQSMPSGGGGGGGRAPAAAPRSGGGGGGGGGAPSGGGRAASPASNPAGAPTRSTAGVQGTPDLTKAKNLSPEQKRNAQVIIDEGKKMGASNRDIQIALMTAMQESGLKNLNYGDRDSVGLFQQRPSCGWGTVAQCTDPHYASQQFYKHLLGIKNRDSMSLTQAAQAVQRSAFPDAYAKWEGLAAGIMQTVGTVA